VSLLLYFLGRFLPKLGGASAPPFFSRGGWSGGRFKLLEQYPIDRKKLQDL
jgi:hypothetical protein